MSSPYGELSQHPDWGKLVRDVENRVDKARQDVLIAAERDELPVVRTRVGTYNALLILLRDLRGA